MKLYKILFKQTETFIVNVFANNEQEATKEAGEKWDEGNYQETGDVNVEIETIYDITGTNDLFNP